eukprot:TRINITY_DN8493_c0_g1_i1.p1 TRINITY_DN8493_c0_g1~~TRINITY_DN8493_c0_g1_i1.p1  ORF type:complete len:1043 (+),score=302.66 TRINITY_DN8493_c0_g1_i1:43-3171(+)
MNNSLSPFELQIKERLEECVVILEKDPQNLKSKVNSLNSLVDFSAKVDDISKYIDNSRFIPLISFYIGTTSKTIRTLGIRILTKYLRTPSFMQDILRYGADYLISMCLEKAPPKVETIEIERILSLKFISACLEVCPSLLSRSLVTSVIGVSLSTDDPLRIVCIQTLGKIAIMNPKILALSDGIKAILNICKNPPHVELQSALMVVVLYLLDVEERRNYIRPGYDFKILFSPLMDEFEYQDQDNLVVWKNVMQCIIYLLRSWTGILYLNECGGFKSIVAALSLNSPALHEIVLDGIIEIFRISKMEGGGESTGTEDSVRDLTPKIRQQHNLFDNFLCLLLVSFVRADLLRGLIEVGSKKEEYRGEDSIEEKNRGKAASLLAELLQMCSFLLPTSLCSVLQTLPSLVQNATSFESHVGTRRVRTRASSMVYNLHSYFNSGTGKMNGVMGKEMGTTNQASSLIGSNKWKRLKGANRRLDRIDDIRVKLEWRLDENVIKTKLQETGILNTKDYQKWNWEGLIELLEGALSNPSKSEIALKTKFFKRILSFLRPENNQFSSITRNKENNKYVVAACECMEILCLTESGYNLLSSNKFLSSVATVLENECKYLEKHTNQRERDMGRFMSEEFVLKTMSREYFTILGSLSVSVRGIKLLKQTKIFNSFKPLLLRDDLCSLILLSIDYNTTYSRQILKHILSIHSPVMRYLATRHLVILYRAGVNSFASWGVEFALQLMEDKERKVRQAAMSLLFEISQNKDCLTQLIASQRGTYFLTSDEFKESKHIIYRFLSLPEGFNYLNESSFIETELKSWVMSKNSTYLRELEQQMDGAIINDKWKQKRNVGEGGESVYLPPHFFGELAKTEDGCKVLLSHKVVSTLLLSLSDHFNGVGDELNARASVVALCQIGGCELGLELLFQYSSSPLLSSKFPSFDPPPLLSSSPNNNSNNNENNDPSGTNGRKNSTSNKTNTINSNTSSSNTPRKNTSTINNNNNLNNNMNKSVLSILVDLMYHSTSLSMRAIAFIGIGLISKTEKGEKKLEERGFEK